MQKIVVTGAAGFLGGRTAKFLANHFKTHRTVATSRRNHRSKELEQSGCTFVAGDLTDFDFCRELTKDAEIVVHCAALSSPYGEYSAFYYSNFTATQSLLNTSIRNGVKRFVFISTPSIYFNFSDRFNVKESDPLPDKMVNNYAKTKLMAERMVLSMNGKGIETIALRPRAIIGAEDTVIIPRVLEAHQQGKLKVVGSGNNVCDLTCVRNVIESIICSINAPQCSCGEAYNITDGKPVEFWKALNYSLESLNLNPPTRNVPKGVAMAAASIVEGKAKIFKQKKEPPLTRYGVGILADNFTLDITKALKKLGYTPVMNTYDGIKEYVEWHKENLKIR